MINQDYDQYALEYIEANPELINRTRINYGPPLLIAVQKKNFKIVKALVEAGADVNHLYYEDDDEPDAVSALSVAASSWQYEIAEYLLKAGADPNNCALQVKTLYLSSPEQTITNRRFSRTPLDEAAAYGDVKMLKLLVKYGGDPKHEIKDKGSALKWGINGVPRGPDGKFNLSGRREVMHYLVKLGCDPNEVFLRSSLIARAARSGNHEIVRILVEEFQVDPFANDTPENGCLLAYACTGIAVGDIGRERAAKTITLLLNYGADPFFADIYGVTPYSLSAKKPDRRKAIDDFLQKQTINPEPVASESKIAP